MKMVRSSFRLKRITAFLLILLFCSACSRTQTVYNFSDWLILKRLDDYFSLNRAQENFLEEKIEFLVAWHRKQELPKLVKDLSGFEARFQDGLSEDDFDWASREYTALWNRLMKKALPDWSLFLTTVDEEQIQHLQTRLKKRNQFLIDQLAMTDAEMQRDAQDWFVELLEGWFGDFSSSQENQIRPWLVVDRRWIEGRLKQRRVFHAMFVELLRSKKSAVRIEKEMGPWVLAPDTVWSPEFHALAEQRKAYWKKTLLKVDATLTPRQRNRGLKKIRNFIKDFRYLASAT